MFLVVFHDIRDCRLCDRTAHRILDFGVRIQESAHDCVRWINSLTGSGHATKLGRNRPRRRPLFGPFPSSSSNE